MRKYLSNALIPRVGSNNMIFLTGDLGFMALEDLRANMGNRFINMGVAEQNMVTVSAALAKQTLEVWVYTIAPFCYARAFEQIRNDICFHNLPVKLIGNGGGYGYGVMGPTHHAIEDYGVLLSLPNMSVYVPAFGVDLESIVHKVAEESGPSYLRLARDESPKNFIVPTYAPWRQLLNGSGPVVIIIGSIVGRYIEAIYQLEEVFRPTLWVLSELPLKKNHVPASLLKQISEKRRLIVIEEHVSRGSFASEFAIFLLEHGVHLEFFKQLRAECHIFDSYGSQDYLRDRSGLGISDLINLLK